MSYEPTGAISDAGLTEIGLKIIGEEGFDPRDEQCLRRAFQQWGDLTSPVQRRAAEQVWLFGWLAGLYREQQRERRAPVAIERPAYVAGHVVDDEPAAETDEPVVPVSEVRFSSQSPEWREPEPERREPEPPQRPVPQAPAVREHVPPPARHDRPVEKFGPVSISHVGGHQKPAPVQQPSRKIVAYQKMFPELGRPVATQAGPKLLADCDARDLEFRIREARDYRQGLRASISTTEARIENRDAANARDRVANAERKANVRDAQALQDRLEKAAAALEESGMTVIGELPEDILDDCGFRRRVA